MFYKCFDLQVNYQKAGIPASDQHPYLECFVPDIPVKSDRLFKRPAFVICPGGGYGCVCADREGEPIALKFASMGIPSFVVHYSVAPAVFPAALLEACTALAFVRAHAEEWEFDPDNIHIGGFSAGGHLSASVGTLWNRDFVCDTLGFHKEEHRPNGLVLSYPVISSDPAICHEGSIQNLYGHDPTPEERELVCLEKQVGPHTPRAFIWHTFEDQLVPVANSLRFAEAMADQKIPCELHVYPHGAHGLALGNWVTGLGMIQSEVQDWCERAARWMLPKAANP